MFTFRMTLKPVQKRGEATRASLVRAAHREFDERGWESTTVRTITRRAGVSVGTLYRYFEDKGALLREVAADRYEELDAAVALDPAPLDGEAEALFERGWQRMIRNCREVLAYHRSAPGLHRVITERRPHDPELEVLAARVDGRLLHGTVALFRAWGMERDVEAAAFAVFHMIESTIISFVNGEVPGVDDEQLCRVMADMAVGTIFGGTRT